MPKKLNRDKTRFSVPPSKKLGEWRFAGTDYRIIFEVHTVAQGKIIYQVKECEGLKLTRWTESKTESAARKFIDVLIYRRNTRYRKL